MAKVMRAKESYHAGNLFVRQGEILHEGDPRIVPLYVEEVISEPPAEEPPKAKRKAKGEE